MAGIDPNIALQAKGIELQDPLAQYARFSQVQNAQNQNALAQYQLSSAKRAEARDTGRMNALSQAGNDPKAIANALLSSGDLAGYQSFIKSQRETEKFSNESTKAKNDAIMSRLKVSREFLDRIDPASPNAPTLYANWLQGQHSDPLLAPEFEQRGVTLDKSLAEMQAALQKGPQGLAELLNRSKLGVEKFAEANKPHYMNINQGGQSSVVALPGLGGAPTTVGTFADVPLPPEVQAQKKATAKASAPNINVSTGESYGKNFGKLVADQDAAKLAAAEGAPKLAETSDRVMDILESGKVFTGTGANVRLQVAKAMNLAGNTDGEKIKNTEVLISSLANTTLDAIKSSGLGTGQGFTDKDREFLEKAKAGQVTYDTESLKALARLSRKAADESAKMWNTRVKSIPSDVLKGTGISTDEIKVPARARKWTGDIPAAAISDLKSGAGTREQFDATFGAGAADRVLGKGK